MNCTDLSLFTQPLWHVARKSSVVRKKAPKSKDVVLQHYFGKKAKVTHTNSTRVFKNLISNVLKGTQMF